MNDIIDFAMTMERDGKAFYEKQAARSTDPNLKRIFITLAEEEDRHYQFFRELKNDPTRPPSSESFAAPGVIRSVQNIFAEMARQTEKQQFGADVISTWAEALRIEEKAVAFYTGKAKIESDASRKSLLQKIAEEETRHVHMIDGVLMYLKYPEAFAQSAQFSNFMSLEGR